MMTEERPIWGIHMEMRHGLRPLSEGFVAIGWKTVGDLSKLPPNREAFKKAVATAYPTTKQGAIPVIAGTLFKFANEMKRGDLIIYPSKPDRRVNLGTVQDRYRFDPQADPAFPNRLSIKWSKHIARAEFSQNALHEIGSAITLFQVRNNAEEFMAAFEGKPLETADVDAETVETASAITEETTIDFVLKQLKSGLDPYQFEKFIAHLLERMGYHARVTQQSADGGVDIIAHKDELGFEAPIIKVQCKQTFSNIGQPEVAQLYGHVEATQHGLFIALGEYTPQARHFERAKHNLRLITGEELVSLIFNHYDQFESCYQMLLPMKKVYIPTAVSKENPGD